VALGLRLDRLVLITLLVYFFILTQASVGQPFGLENSLVQYDHLLNSSLTCLSILAVLKVGIFYN